MYDFVQVVPGVCPEPLRDCMRMDKSEMARSFKMKDVYDEKRCEQNRRDESTRT